MNSSAAAVLTARLEQLGWPADDGLLHQATPAIARGNNVIASLPPSPAWADPVIAAVLEREPDPDPASFALLLASPAMLDEWALAVGALIESTDQRVIVADPSHPELPLRASCALLIATPESALARHQASALHPERIRTIVLAWPDDWDADDALTALLQDTPRDAQRIVLSSRGEPVGGDIAERYARKATLIQHLSTAASITPAGAMITTTPTSWAGRASTVAELVAGMAEKRVVVWTANTRDHQLLRRHIAVVSPAVQIASRGPVQDTDVVICYDPPSHAQLAQFAVGHTALLAPPGTERHIARIAPARKPLDLAHFATRSRTRDAARRESIVAEIRRDPSAALYALGPLFEQFEAQQVAAALYELWTQPGHARGPAPEVSAPVPVAEPQRADRGAPVKLWVGAGKKDDATVADYVAILVREVGMDRAQIGRIELRDTFALVEVPALDAEAIATRLTGLTLRRRKLLARVDSRRAAQRGGP